MSKYHPLDVRHPSNKHRQRNSYLLLPSDSDEYALRPLRETQQSESRRPASYSTFSSREADESAQSNGQPRAAKTPWGRLGNKLAERAAPAANAAVNTHIATPAPPLVVPQRRRSWIPRLIFFGFVAYAILRNTAVGEELSRFISSTLYQLGLL